MRNNRASRAARHMDGQSPADRSLQIAFVQDCLPYWGGAEQVLAEALEVFPEAPVYTLVYNRDAFRGTEIDKHPVLVSPLNRLPTASRRHQLLLPLMPLALEAFDLSHLDVIVSFSYAVAHAAPTRSDQLHISYIHTPMRYAWRNHLMTSIVPPIGRLASWLAGPYWHLFRYWDKAMAGRTHCFVTNSHWMAGRIQNIYQRNADVLYPPVDTDRFRPLYPRDRYYICVARLVAHKRLDLVVQAFSRLGYPLLIIGQGPEEPALRAMAGPNVHFLGWQPASSLANLLGRAKAFVQAGQEDFGIAMAEAQAAGCPVIALKQGGAQEIVCNRRTGMLFDHQDVASLCEAVECFEREGVECRAE